MKRDMELVIKILKYLEDRRDVSMIKQIKIPGYDNLVVTYHIHRIYEAGLLDAETENSKSTINRLIHVYPFGLTWEGHEFLDSMRNKQIMAQVKHRLGNTLSDIPFTLLKELALSVGRTQLGL